MKIFISVLMSTILYACNSNKTSNQNLGQILENIRKIRWDTTASHYTPNSIVDYYDWNKMSASDVNKNIVDSLKILHEISKFKNQIRIRQHIKCKNKIEIEGYLEKKKDIYYMYANALCFNINGKLTDKIDRPTFFLFFDEKIISIEFSTDYYFDIFKFDKEKEFCLSFDKIQTIRILDKKLKPLKELSINTKSDLELICINKYNSFGNIEKQFFMKPNAFKINSAFTLEMLLNIFESIPNNPKNDESILFYLKSNVYNNNHMFLGYDRYEYSKVPGKEHDMEIDSFYKIFEKEKTKSFQIYLKD